jgi:hypothetical protein
MADEEPNQGKRTRYDDFSTDPRNWSLEKLCRERRHGMPAVKAEWSRRLDEDADSS